MENGVIRDMTEGSVTRQLVRFSVPFMLSNLLGTLYTLVDLAVIGKYTDSVGVSAVSIAGSVTFLLYVVGIAFGNGGGIFIAQLTGAKRYKELNETIGTLVSFCVLLALVLMAVGYAGAWPLMRLLNAPDGVLPAAVSYMGICLIGIPFAFCSGTFADMMKGMGDSMHPLIISLVSTLLNLVLDVLFVACFRWGVAGAAWATAISQIAGCLFAALFLYRRREQIHFDFKLRSFAIKKDKLRVAAKLSLPLMFMSLAIQVSMMYVNAYVNAYGVVAMAVAGIGSRINGFCQVVTSGIQNATSSVVGQNMGAGKIKRVRKTVYAGWLICMGFCVVWGLICLLLPEQLFSIFSNDAAVLAMSRQYMRVQAVFALAFAMMCPPLGFVNGVGNTLLNMIIALLDGVVARIGLSLLMGITLGMGLAGFWWGNALAGFVSVIMAGWYFFFGKWENRRLLKHE